MKNFVLCLGSFCAIGLATVVPAPVAAQSKTTEVVAAADKFLGTLSIEQRQKVIYSFDDATQRARWSNFPTGFVPRGGMSLEQMTPEQKDAVMKLLATVLSPMGFEKVSEIRQADDAFAGGGSRSSPGRRGRMGSGLLAQFGRPPGGPGGFGGGRMFGADLYYISFLGLPSTTNPWMLQFGGHHLGLNVTIVGSKGVLTPSLTGAQPAVFTVNGKTVRPLGRESDKALALLQSLDDAQRKQAVLGYFVPDLVLGPGQDGRKIAPEGLKASAMNPKQQSMLLDVIAEWAGILNESSATARMAELKAELNDTWFAWSGPTTGQIGSNITAYYRIQGPHLVIEYAPQRDEPDNHVHTIYRDPTNDYGMALLKR